MWAKGEINQSRVIRAFAFGDTMIQIDDDVPMPPVRVKGWRVPASVTKAIDEYAKAYWRLYGVSTKPVAYEQGFVFLDGASEGISVALLKRRTTQLKFRKGS